MGEEQKWREDFDRELETEDTTTNLGIEGRIMLLYIRARGQCPGFTAAR
jgi:hypothetical protein